MTNSVKIIQATLGAVALLGTGEIVGASTATDAINHAKHLADNNLGTDDGGRNPYGAQCVALVNDILRQQHGIALGGNAINLLDSAAAQGLTVEYAGQGTVPRAGAIYVMAVNGHEFGHTGIVIEDSDGFTMTTIEQNVDGYSDNNLDGVNDQFQFGGPARYMTRNMADEDGTVIGWFYPNYTPEQTETIQQASLENQVIESVGIFTVTVDSIWVRTDPSTAHDTDRVATRGEVIQFDQVVKQNGITWVSFLDASGVRRYVAANVLGTDRSYGDIQRFS